MEEQKRGCDNSQTSNNSKQPIFLGKQVTKCKDSALKERLRVLIKSKGMSESDFYHLIEMSKQNWYSYSWGLWQPTLELKVRIAKALGVDSSVIWQESK